MIILERDNAYGGCNFNQNNSSNNISNNMLDISQVHNHCKLIYKIIDNKKEVKSGNLHIYI